MAILYTFYTLGQVPLLAVFSGSGAGVLQATRVTAYRGFAGNVYLRNLVAIGLPPILSFAAIGYYWMYRTHRWAVLSLVLVVLAALMAIHGLSKAPLLNYLLGIVFLSVLVGKLRPKHILLIATGLASLVVALYVVLGRVTDPRLLFALNTGPVGRILLGQITSLFYHFRIFPEEHPLLRGASLPALLLKLLGSDQVHKTSARLVMEIVNPTGVASGQAGVMNTLFVGEAFANWGWLGVALAPFWVGFVIQVIYVFCLRTRKTPLLVGIFAFLSYQIPSMVTGGFVGFLYNPGVLALVLLGLGPFIGGIVSKATLRPQRHVSHTS
jgi:oligosaccharide repeat unit polymerase